MTCKHINEAKTKISILIDSGAIHTEMGPFLTLAEAESIVSPNRWTSGDSSEIRRIAKKYPVIDRGALQERLREINILLSLCNCSNELNKTTEAVSEELNERELSLLSIKKDNERLIGEKINWKQILK
jgi:hypothetical protein